MHSSFVLRLLGCCKIPQGLDKQDQLPAVPAACA